MLYSLTPAERYTIAKMALDDRIEQLREAMQALDALKLNHPKRKRFEHDVLRAARGLLLPLRKVDPLRNPNARTEQTDSARLAIEADAPAILRDAAKPDAPANPWEQQAK